ncbi:hypothetical protein D3C86_1594130 [compost metagenome]
MKRNAVTECHVDINGTGPDDAEQMRHERDAARPGGNDAVVTPHGHALHPRIGDGDRLHINELARNLFSRSGSRAEQRGFDGEHAVAIRGGAFGEQDDNLAIGHAAGDLAHLRAGAALLLALHEDAFLQTG